MSMRKLGIIEWLVRLFQCMIMDVRSRVRVGDECIKEIGVGVGDHQDNYLEGPGSATIKSMPCFQPATLHHSVRGSIPGVPHMLSMGAAVRR